MLNNRPKKTTDFKTSGKTIAKVGVLYSFGQDIGYNGSVITLL
jgi:hypothetical protein